LIGNGCAHTAAEPAAMITSAISARRIICARYTLRFGD
jgi:hypothetical protein